MKNNLHSETRAGCVERHVRAYIRETGISEQAYAAELVMVYHDRTPIRQRTVLFHADGEAYRDLTANTQIVHRMLGGDVRLPVDIEEAAILALPEERARRAWVDLAARVGRISVAHPEDGVAGVAEDLGRLSVDAGELLQAMGALLEDNRNLGGSEADLRLARERARKLAAQAHSIIHRLSDELQGREPKGGPALACVGTAGGV